MALWEWREQVSLRDKYNGVLCHVNERLTYLKDQPHLNKIATKSAISDKNI